MQIFTFFVNNVLFHGFQHLKQQTKYERPLIFLCCISLPPRLMADDYLEQLPPFGAVGTRERCRRSRGEVSQVRAQSVAGQAGNCRRSVPKV